MAVSITNLSVFVAGSKRMAVATVTFDSSYPTGGEPVTAANLGLATLDALFAADAVNATPANLTVRFDRTNAKLLVFRTGLLNAAGEQVPDTTDLSAFSTVVLAVGV
ncbi:MAG: hypothetical protein ACRD0D_00985 [Acidimicrobiales bacterium]